MTEQFSNYHLTGEQLDELATQAISIFGRRGSGKTYAAARLCECLYYNESPFVVIDPVGNLWSLRLMADGKKQGLPITILGGRHGDLPLPAEGGAVAAEFFWNGGTGLRSLVLDLSEFEDEEHELLRFAVDFGQRFYTLSRQYQQVATLILEEAHFFVPEQPQSKMAQKCRNIYRRHVRVGRNFGQGCVVSSQRPQSVDKETVNQSEVLVVGQLVGKHERDRIRQWTRDVSDDATKLVDELPKLRTGEFYLFSPSWLQAFRKIHVERRLTFDASATPKLRKARGIVDPSLPRREGQAFEALRAALGEAVTQWENDDPRRLREQLAALRRELEALQAESRETSASTAILEQVRVLSFNSHEMICRLGEITETSEALTKSLTGLTHYSKTTLELARRIAPDPEVRPSEIPSLGTAKPSGPHPLVSRSLASTSSASIKTTRVHRQTTETHETEEIRLDTTDYASILLSVIATHGPVDKGMIAVLARKSKRSSTLDIKLGELVKQGLVTRERGVYLATAAGKKKAPPLELPTGLELVRFWQQKLSDYEAELLRQVMHAYPRVLGYDDLARQAGKSRRSSTFDMSVSKLVKLGLFERGNKAVRLGATLRDSLTGHGQGASS